MKLILDFGNTFKKYALFEGKVLKELKIFEKDDYKKQMLFLSNNKNVKSIIISSVIDYPESLNNYLQENYYFIKLNPQTPVPVKNKYKTQNTLGKDRLAAVVGANVLFPENNVLVIEAGTCITYDFINSEAEYLGGSISPGLNMRYKSLNNFTDKLPLVTNRDFKCLTGQTTEESIISGISNGIIAEVDGIIELYKKKYSSLKIVLGGGDMNFFVNKLKNSIFANPNIVLEGLNEILDFNEKRKINANS